MTDKQTKQSKQLKDWGLFRIFGGALLLVVGILLLLGNIGVLDVNLYAIWRLWPLVLIGFGVSLLPIRGWAAYATIGALLAVSVVAVVLVTTNNFSTPDESREFTQSVAVSAQSDQVKQVDVEVDYGGGEISLSSHDSADLVTAQLNSERFNLNHDSQLEDGTQDIEIEIEDSRMFNFGGLGKMDLSLGRNLPADLSFDIGATHLHGDLSQVNLRNLSIDGGASKVALKLGAIASLLNIDIDVGASSIQLAVPESAGVEVHSDTGLSSQDFSGIDKVKGQDGLYRSAGFDDATNKIIIYLDAGVSSIDITRY